MNALSDSTRVCPAERGENLMVIARGWEKRIRGHRRYPVSPRDTSSCSPHRRLRSLPNWVIPRGAHFFSICRLSVKRSNGPAPSDGLVRVNYEILGNTDAFLHAHIFPALFMGGILNGRANRRLSTLPITGAIPTYQYTDIAHGLLRERICARAHRNHSNT